MKESTTDLMQSQRDLSGVFVLANKPGLPDVYRVSSHALLGGSCHPSPSLATLIAPVEGQLPHLTPLRSRCNRPLSFTFDYQVRALIYSHIEGFTSAQDLLQAAEGDPLARTLIVPESGLGQSTFYEANLSRGVEQMIELLDRLLRKVTKRLKVGYLA